MWSNSNQTEFGWPCRNPDSTRILQFDPFPIDSANWNWSKPKLSKQTSQRLMSFLSTIWHLTIKVNKFCEKHFLFFIGCFWTCRKKFKMNENFYRFSLKQPNTLGTWINFEKIISLVLIQSLILFQTLIFFPRLITRAILRKNFAYQFWPRFTIVVLTFVIS